MFIVTVVQLYRACADVQLVCVLPLLLCAAVRPSLCGRCLQLAVELDICNPAAEKHYRHQIIQYPEGK